jgi:DNA-damage-inducible protein D
LEKNIEKYTEKVFEDIKHIGENGIEFWYARELQQVLEYMEWRNFCKAIEKAKTACKSSKNLESDHFVDVNKIVKTGVSSKEIEDYKLSRYACYLIVQNGDPRKKVIALGQTYFAIQTRKQELSEQEYLKLSEDEKRLYSRKIIKNQNKYLFDTAKNCGVENYGKFNNYGYRGLYNGETAKQIAKRKELKPKEDILDFMGSEELSANLFRITQTDSILKKNEVIGETNACKTHHKVGCAIRHTIAKIGGTMPEDLPTPKKSVREIENKSKTLNFEDSITIGS